jgi:hypothetical protein
MEPMQGAMVIEITGDFPGYWSIIGSFVACSMLVVLIVFYVFPTKYKWFLIVLALSFIFLLPPIIRETLETYYNKPGQDYFVCGHATGWPEHYPAAAAIITAGSLFLQRKR